jgi:predicted small lipoprotein YifL
MSALAERTFNSRNNAMRIPRFNTAAVVVSLLILSALTGCGKKGALIPPEALVPAPVSNLAVAQKSGFFQVSWSAPTKEQGGRRLTDLAGFILFRRVLLPAELDCDECPGAYAERARITLDYLGETRQVGNLYLFDDHDLKESVSYQYKVRSFSVEGAESRDSNRAHRTAVTPPLPPVLEALSSSTGVVLAFVAIPPEAGKLLGYNIYRSQKGEPAPLSPLNPKPVSANKYEDKALLLGVHYSYSVRTVAVMPNEELVESAPSNLAEGSMLERD